MLCNKIAYNIYINVAQTHFQTKNKIIKIKSEKYIFYKCIEYFYSDGYIKLIKFDSIWQQRILTLPNVNITKISIL